MSRSKNTKLQLFALDMQPSSWDNEVIYQLYIPDVWRVWVRQLRKGGQESDYALEKRIKPLGDKLQSIFPDLIMVDNQFYKEGIKSPWLLAVRSIPTDILFLLVKVWFLKIASEATLPVPDEVHASELRWYTVTVNQACEHNKGLYFNLLPSLVTHRFCMTEKTIQLKEDVEPLVLRFSKVFAKQNGDCMSQPISTRSGYQFSYVVRFRLKTRGGEPNRFMLLCSFGIRRFRTKPVNTEKLKGKIYSTLLVSMDNPFLDADHDAVRSYASFSYRRQGREAPYTRWREGLDELFSELLLGRKFSPEEVLTNPSQYGEGSNPRVMIVHNQQIYRSHPVGTGISIEEKKQFFKMVTAELSQWTPVAPMYSVTKPKSTLSLGKDKLKIPPLLVPHAKDFVLEIWGPDSLYIEVMQSLREKKYKLNHIVEEVETGIFRLASMTSNRLILVRREQQGFVDALNEAHGKDAYTHRANFIQRNLEHAEPGAHVVLALIEILPKENWLQMWEDADPKLAVREGFRRTGRLTQFIYPNSVEEARDEDEEPEGEQGSYKHKVFNAILDLLSDAGIVDYKPLSEIGEVCPILAFDLVQVDHGIFPILTKLEKGELFVRGDGIEGWLPLQQAILCSQMLKSIAPSIGKGKSQLTRWLDDQLSREKHTNEGFILLVGANLRTKGLWSLTNNRVTKYQNPPIASWIEEDPNIIVIRINTTDEVPAYGFNPLSLSTGVYTDGVSGLYYGIGSKGISQRNISKSLTKLHNPSKTFQQPRAVEYMPMGRMDESERDRLAWVVQWMREMCVSFETTTTLPYPLKMLNSLEKYIKRRSEEWEDGEVEFV